MSFNQNLLQARRAAKDEFYTQLPDIENELQHYKAHFKDKVVYCNCDDPRISKFFHYFSYNFQYLGLKKLITTCSKNQQMDVFSKHDQDRAIKLEYDGFRDAVNIPHPEDIGIAQLQGDGDFRSLECIEFLKQADIVVTNPPFSLFREYVDQLVKHEKQFLIIGNMNATTYKEIFPLIKDNRLWYGPSISSGDREFGVPDHYPLTAATCRTDENGKKFIRVKGVRWFTNLDHNKRHEELYLSERYDSNSYPKYDNYDAINVDETKNIPKDWKGAMGVPISFLDKYNPDQFEIIGMDHDVKNGLLPHIVNPEWTGKIDRGYVEGKRLYSRILIRNRRPET